ncbi:MAG: respiratory nitrate reductase subunit gamma [Deltaproteobacteria bacterium]
MLNNFIFIVMPYTALVLLIFVTPFRYFSNRLTWSAYSTQFLERKALFWGINPWHYGIIPVLAAHFVGVVFPGPIKALLGNQRNLVVIESIGLALGLFAVFGCLALLLRRVNSPILKNVTFASDWVLLYLLAAQALSGIYISTFMRWGSQWYLHSAVPYLWSLATFSPQVEYMADFPLILKLHAAGAFLIVALLPFTKLVHLLYLPIDFLKDPPILYRWRSRAGG